MALGEHPRGAIRAKAGLSRLTAANQTTKLIWTLGLGALGLAWSVTTVAAYLPPLLQRYTTSSVLIGLVLAAEGIFAIILPLVVGPLSDATRTPLGRRRPYMIFAIGPMSVSLAMLAFMPSLWSAAFVFFAFCFSYYVYEPPYRGLYPDLLPDAVFGRAQGAQHVMRGAALGGALVLGGILLHTWEPFPFVVAAVLTGVSCGLVVVLVREGTISRKRTYDDLRTYLKTPYRILLREQNVRRFLIANTAWEATFAGMRTFVVLYLTVGLAQPLFVSSAVLAVVALGYLVAAVFSGPLGDRFGLGRVILVASVVYGLGMLGASFAQHWHAWYYPLLFLIAIAAGAVMTLAWGLLFKLMPRSGRGATAGLAVMTKGIGLLLGPLVVGAGIQIASTFLETTKGYQAMWLLVALPVLAVIPLVRKLERAEGERVVIDRERAPIV
jgi:MFS family permease